MTGVLDGQVAIVSGAGRGIGLAIAMTLAEAGAAVALVARTEADVDTAASTIARAGGRAIACVADVTHVIDVRGVVDRTERDLGPVTLLINGAVRTDMTAAYLRAPGASEWLPALHQAPEDFWAPPEAVGALCLRLATGAYDRLSGRFLAITDKLDDLLARAEEIRQKDLYVLRLRD
jgi:NAD(P)-dependent dehydrogenase (short-subunit alcohol dehydrogenase family)